MTDIVERLRSAPIQGCQDCYERLRDEAADEIERLRAITANNATIERCAQVADKYRKQYGYFVAADIAAAIRALKDSHD